MTPPAQFDDLDDFERFTEGTTSRFPSKVTCKTQYPPAARILQFTDYHPPLLLPSFPESEPFTPGVEVNQLQQPDIGWHPNYSNYCDRVKRNKLRRGSAPLVQLPFGYPREVESPLVWSGPGLRQKGEDKFIFNLTSDEISEAETALNFFKGKWTQSTNFFRYCTYVLWSRRLRALLPSRTCSTNDRPTDVDLSPCSWFI